jgi:hypothetical protein
VMLLDTPPSLTQLFNWCYDLSPSKRPRISNVLKFFRTAVLPSIGVAGAQSSSPIPLSGGGGGGDAAAGTNRVMRGRSKSPPPPPKKKATDVLHKPLGTSM